MTFLKLEVKTLKWMFVSIEKAVNGGNQINFGSSRGRPWSRGQSLVAKQRNLKENTSLEVRISLWGASGTIPSLGKGLTKDEVD